jgi:homoserine O-acetyltransferase
MARARGPLLALLWLGQGCSQQSASIGDFRLENGQVIRDCQIGYRTFGRLDQSGSNAVLVTLWSMGKSSQVAGQIGPGKLVDTSRYFVVAVDPLGNGVSSSPSNHPQQGGEGFPVFTVGDLVESQHQLVTKVLGLRHLRAVVGISLGGMQAFQWATAHPELVDKIVSISGTPRATPEETARWQSWSRNMQRSRWRRAAGELGRWSPLGALGQLRTDQHDYDRQARAIAAMDVSRPFGSMEAAARAVRARMLVVFSATDEVVNPAAALQFAGLTGARLLELDGRCGHSAPACEKQTLWPAVRQFLDE